MIQSSRGVDRLTIDHTILRATTEAPNPSANAEAVEEMLPKLYLQVPSLETAYSDSQLTHLCSSGWHSNHLSNVHAKTSIVMTWSNVLLYISVWIAT